MKDWFAEFAIIFSVLVGAPIILLFTTRVPEGWTFVNRAAFETGECWDSRTNGALVRANGEGGMSMMRTFVLDRTAEYMGSSDSWPVAAFIRRLWLDLILSDDEVQGAYCQLARPGRHNLPTIARIVGIGNVVTSTEQELAALAYVYVAHMHVSRTNEELIPHVSRAACGER